MSETQPIVSVRELDYTYRGAASQTLESLSFQIHPGEIFGFLGPNASGKTTTQKILTRILRSFVGEVEVFGQDLRAHGDDYYSRIGVCFEFPNLYERLSASENLSFYRDFFPAPTDDPEALLERLDLPVRSRQAAGSFSKGMKTRLVLARSLLNRPQLWFLDEPTSGQDPMHAVEIRNLIREKANEGTTVFLTTHNMTLAEELCDRVAFIEAGRIAVVDSPHALALRHARKRVRVEYREGDSLEQRELEFETTQDREALAAFLRDRPVETIHSLEPSLEDVFLEVTGQKLGD